MNNRLLIVGLIAMLSISFMPHLTIVCFSQDSVETAREALSNRNYPWYDREADDIQRFDFRERPDASSADRDSIPLKPKTATARQPRNFNLANRNGLTGLSWVAWVCIGLVIIAIVGVLAWAFLKMESNVELEDEARNQRSIEESIQQLPFDIEQTDGDFRKLAQQAYSNGDFRRAIIYLFSHVLVSLDQKSLIRLRKGKTNRQYLMELKPYRELANYYQRVMVPFEATFFGEHDLERSDFENCWNRLDGFQTGIEQTTQVADA